jgi:hypothetical protein
MSDSPYLKNPRPLTERYDTHVVNPLVRENCFLNLHPEIPSLPSFPEVKNSLPDPYWEGRQTVIDCYWQPGAGLRNLRSATPENGSYRTTAILPSTATFLCRIGLITFFGVYGGDDFQGTLKLLLQTASGWLYLPELSGEDGQDAFQRFDPSSTGPNILPWAEWNYFLKTGDRARLECAFPSCWLTTSGSAPTGPGRMELTILRVGDAGWTTCPGWSQGSTPGGAMGT